MNEPPCDIHDVTRAASDLVATGCNIGMTHLSDGFARMRFSTIVAAYANEVVQAVEAGLISAWDGVQAIQGEYAELSSKARFYVQNGISVAAGVMQVRAGVAVTAMSGGLAAVPGTFLIAHGTNNIYEGLGNFYSGPNAQATVGPVRHIYQTLLRDEYRGNMYYYSIDLLISGYGLVRNVQKPGSFELFRYDPVTREKAYRQAGKLSLVLEALVDFFTLDSMRLEESRRQ
ncbi:DUF4225 domain-containing protein [Pseudomonas sp. GB2N2]